MSIIDCGPSRFAVLTQIRSEGVDSIVSEIARVFSERCAPQEILVDNYSSFHSDDFIRLMNKWR